ncbi:MAG: hypothetical protein WHS87_09320 [Anaerolineales bacterium]
MSRFFLLLALLTLLTACAAPNVGGGPLTVDRGTPTLPPTSTPTPRPTHTPTPTLEPTPTEAPLTLDELGIKAEEQSYFRGVEKALQRRVNENGEVLYTTTATFWDGEQKITADYIIEQRTFDAHPEISDDLTRPRSVRAYRLPRNYRNMKPDRLELELVEVTLLWQGPERGFREAFDLTNAFDPELKQVEKHPYLHIVHGNRPIQSIKDLPKDDERLTALQSVRLEQAKAIRALQDIRQKLQSGESITPEDFQGSVFLSRLQEKLQAGEPITEDDLYVLFSAKAVEKWDAGGGLSLYFELQKDGSKWVHLKAKGDDQPNQTYDSLNMKLTPLWFYTQDEEGNRYEKAVVVILDIDDIERYKSTRDPLTLQGKFIIGENRYDVEISPDNTYWQELYKQNKPSSPVPILYAEGGDYFTKTDEELIQEMTKKGIDRETQAKILSERARLTHLLSLPDNDPGKLPYLALPDKNGQYPYKLQDLYPEGFGLAQNHPQHIGERYVGQAIFENGEFTGLYDWAPLPSTFQLLELMFDVRISN